MLLLFSRYRNPDVVHDLYLNPVLGRIRATAAQRACGGVATCLRPLSGSNVDVPVECEVDVFGLQRRRREDLIAVMVIVKFKRFGDCQYVEREWYGGAHR